MREKLKDINGVRRRFIATFSRYGLKPVFKGAPVTTLLFTNVRDSQGNIYADHIWFTITKGFSQYNFTEGDNIVFDARVKTYYKGYKGRRGEDDDDYIYNPVTEDYKLSHPNNIVKSEIGKPQLLF